MSKVEIFEHVEVSQLPKAWRDRLGLGRGSMVRVTVAEETPRQIDKVKLRETVRQAQALPVLSGAPDQ